MMNVHVAVIKGLDPSKLSYTRKALPTRARVPVTYASADKTAVEPEFHDEELEFEEEIPEPPRHLQALFDQGDEEVLEPLTYLWASFNEE